MISFTFFLVHGHCVLHFLWLTQTLFGEWCSLSTAWFVWLLKTTIVSQLRCWVSWMQSCCFEVEAVAQCFLCFFMQQLVKQCAFAFPSFCNRMNENQQKIPVFTQKLQKCSQESWLKEISSWETFLFPFSVTFALMDDRPTVPALLGPCFEHNNLTNHFPFFQHGMLFFYLRDCETSTLFNLSMCQAQLSFALFLPCPVVKCLTDNWQFHMNFFASFSVLILVSCDDPWKWSFD